MSDRLSTVAGTRGSSEVGVRGIDARTTPDDDALVDRLRRGDRDAFELLVRRYHGSLTRIAMGYVSTRQGAEELAQDAWMGVLQGLERFEGRSSFRTWLFAILVNRAKTRGLREGRTLPFSAIPGPDSPGEPDVPPSRFDTRGRWAEPPAAWRDATPEALLVGAETRRALSDAIAALPDNYRIVLTLRDLEGLDAEDVCRVLGISESNQRVLLHRARSKVRQALEAHFTAK